MLAHTRRRWGRARPLGRGRGDSLAAPAPASRAPARRSRSQPRRLPALCRVLPSTLHPALPPGAKPRCILWRLPPTSPKSCGNVGHLFSQPLSDASSNVSATSSEDPVRSVLYVFATG